MAKKLLTLAQFKRDAASGHMGLELIERYGKKITKPVIVPVVKVQTNGVYLKRGDNESFLDYPFASLFEYTGTMVKVYDTGLRKLNPTEEMVMRQWHQISNNPQFRERARIDALTDGNYTGRQEELFFKQSPCPYLYTERNGLRYDHNTGKVYDPKVKGKCVLVYKVHKI